MAIEFEVINKDSWARAQTYEYFTEKVSTLIYSINVTVDVTTVWNAVKKQGVKFFPAYLYFVTRTINSQPAFLMGMKDQALGTWTGRTPCYPLLRQDKTIAFTWTKYQQEFSAFYQQYLLDKEQQEKNKSLMSVKGTPPLDCYIIACIPWFSFNSLSMQLQNAKDYYAPLIESGGFTKQSGKVTMPLSLTVNHAVVDGYHIKEFLDCLQENIENASEWL